MQNEESLNLLNQKPGNVKNALVQKLSKQWPLTLKQLDHALKREFGMDVTYQAVHKAATQLEDEKVIEKIKEGYQLHPEWIQNITKLSNQISQAYANNQVLDFEKEIIQLTFTSWINAGRFGAFTFKTECPNPQRKPIVTCWLHVWPVSTVSAEESKQLLEQVRNGHDLYCLCPNNTPLDQLFADWIGKMGRKNILGANLNLNHDYIIVGDHIAQIYYEEKFRKKIDSFYKKNTDIKNIDYQKMQELATERTNIQAIVIKNAQLAERLRNEGLLLFK